MVKGGLARLKKYLALGFRHYQRNPAPMPKHWIRKKDGSIFKAPPRKARILEKAKSLH
jgi:hypothetical protein